MDVTKSAEPRSDQQNYDDYIGGPRVVTITDVKKDGEGRLSIHLAEYPGRPYKPAKSMIRVLIAAWSSEASKWVGRSMRLFGEPTVKFGGKQVGGIRIAALSDIDKPLTVNLTITRGQRAPFTVEPLQTENPVAVAAALDNIDEASSMPALKAAWDLAGKQGVQSHPDVIAAKDKKKEELS